MELHRKTKMVGGALIAGLLLAGLAWAVVEGTAGRLEPGEQRSFQGPKGDEFQGPLGIAVDDKGNLIVADSGRGRVVLLDGKGRLRHRLDLAKGMGNKPPYPVAVAVDPQGNIYVAEPNGGRVSRFAQGEGEVTTFPVPAGQGPWRPLALTCDSEGNLFVSDGEKQRILHLSPEGELLGSFGEAGQGPGQLAFPNGLAWDEEKQLLWVADSNNGRLQAFSREGEVVALIDRGPQGETFYPRGLTFDKATRTLYFSDPLNQGIFAYQIEEKTLTPLNGDWKRPGGVALGEGFLAVADRGNNRIVLWGLPDKKQ